MKNLFLVTLFIFGPSFSVSAQDIEKAYLDSPYENLVHPINDLKTLKSNFEKSETLEMLKFQSSVKSQGSRGTCSIFSATAMVEAMLKINKKVGMDEEIDLSEEWLQYIAVSYTRSTTGGSYSSKNFRLLLEFGMVYEDTLAYDPDDWSSSSWGVAADRCNHLVERDLRVCKLAHFDPSLYSMTEEELNGSLIFGAKDILNSKKDAAKFRDDYLEKKEGATFPIYSISEIKALLKKGVPVTLGLDFFYGAWNHQTADTLDIGRSLSDWQNGIVGYPEKLSVDYLQSRKTENKAGHSILVVGFDDTKVIETNVRMKDGTMKKFSYQGVYYFKNSWGTDSFGIETLIDNELFPGYGIITQQYAHEYGAFYQLPLN